MAKGLRGISRRSSSSYAGTNRIRFEGFLLRRSQARLGPPPGNSHILAYVLLLENQ